MTSPLTDTATDLAFDFTRLFSSLRASMIQQLYAIWFGLDNYRDESITGWMDVALPIVQAGRETSTLATGTYMQLQMELAGLDVSNLDLSEVLTEEVIRNGATEQEVYSRPFKQVWESLNKGNSFDVAVEDGANRLRQLVETDIQLSHTHTSRSLLSRRNDVVGFRRIPTGNFTCALCLVASTQRYNKLDLMPIHPGCDCRVAPIIGESDPGQVVDREFLNEIHKAVEQTFGFSAQDARKIDYRKIAVTRQHGEYGPLLAAKWQHTTIL